jgi:polyisoprenoid-binding protein YceI
LKSICALCVAFALSASAHAADYRIEKGSTLGFAGTFQGEVFSGSFAKFHGEIRYDSTNIESSKFDVVVELASVSTGDTDRDAALPGSDFFHTATFPNAHFVTRQFRQAGDEVIAEGTLTIKGVSKPVDLKVSFDSKGAGATLDISTRVNRLDFGIGTGEYADTSTIADEVSIKAHLELGAKL